MAMHFDKFFETVVRERASEAHLTPGQPPVVRLHDRFIKLETRSLEPDDTEYLVQTITPDDNQRQLDEIGGTDFEFNYTEHARFRAAVFKQRGHLALVLRRVFIEA